MRGDLVSRPIGGVLEGARYLKALNEVGVTAMRMQRIASFGTLAQRVRHEASNPLAVARLASNNLRADLRDILAGLESEEDPHSLTPERIRNVGRRLDVIEASLDETGGKLLDLLKFSQRIGFTQRMTQWNDVVREVLIWLAAERQRRSIELHVRYGELPALYVEPNELFGVLVTVVRLAMDAVGQRDRLLEVATSVTADRRYVRTQVGAPDAQHRERVRAILEPDIGSSEELTPIHFEWQLAVETIDAKYGGNVSWRMDDKGLVLTLDLPVHG
jgi:signal transduction histidine kinase